MGHYAIIREGDGMKCLVCKRKFYKKYPKNGTVIRVQFSHSMSLDGSGMWDDMGEAFICSWKCYKKLTQYEELIE